uniref:Uncharacterized protein n=1 Tax=Mucochytrium quahogii TaxID=96639 RepID=A0A7S2S9U6_9STRA|mmetsp:Transcript_2754/g.5874  ORF Transcript_2754/g.5874 Transcript_2754/m.5874 type:complete len:547 (+) Transcript_2754:1009-2649(+)
MKFAFYLATSIPLISGLGNVNRLGNVNSFIPTLPRGFSLEDHTSAECNSFINGTGDDYISQLTACSILQNHIHMGILDAWKKPDGDLTKIQQAFNTSARFEMLQDGCFKMTVRKTFEERRTSFASTEEYLSTLTKSYGVSVDVKGSYGAITAEVGYQREQESVKSMAGLHSYSKAEYSSRVISATLKNTCLRETCNTNGKKCTKRYLTPAVLSLVEGMVNDPSNGDKVSTFLTMYGVFLPNQWHYGASNFTEVEVKFDKESEAKSETISNALNAAVSYVDPTSSASVETQIKNKFEEVAKSDKETTQLDYTSKVVGPCGKVGWSSTSYDACLDILMEPESWVSPLEIGGYTTIIEAVAAKAETLKTLTRTTYYTARGCARVNGHDGEMVYRHPTKELFMQCEISSDDKSDSCSFKKLGPKTNFISLHGQRLLQSQAQLTSGTQVVRLSHLDGKQFGVLDRGLCHHKTSPVRAVPNQGHCGSIHWFIMNDAILCEDTKNCVRVKDGQTTLAHIYHYDENQEYPSLEVIHGITKDFDGYPEVCTPSQR